MYVCMCGVHDDGTRVVLRLHTCVHARECMAPESISVMVASSCSRLHACMHADECIAHVSSSAIDKTIMEPLFILNRLTEQPSQGCITCDDVHACMYA